MWQTKLFHRRYLCRRICGPRSVRSPGIGQAGTGSDTYYSGGLTQTDRRRPRMALARECTHHNVYNHHLPDLDYQLAQLIFDVANTRELPYELHFWSNQLTRVVA